MIQEISGHFDNSYAPHEPTAADYVLHFSGPGLLARLVEPGAGAADAGDAEAFELPCLASYPEAPAHVTYLFSVGGRRFFLAPDDELTPPEGYTYETLARLRQAQSAQASETLFAQVTAAHLNRWYRDNRFCGRCGAPMRHSPTLRALCCPSCKTEVFPKICPAVICGVVSPGADGGRIVLTHYRGRTTALWALVAGYNEIGESLEDTVRREVAEEVGLSVRNIRYYKSQPWGFTGSLLAGFWCEVEGDGAITLQEDELSEARWFAPAEVPLERASDAASLTGEMIERFRSLGSAVLQ